MALLVGFQLGFILCYFISKYKFTEIHPKTFHVFMNHCHDSLPPTSSSHLISRHSRGWTYDMDVLDLMVGVREVQALDRDLRPVWRESGMPCPVASCGTDMIYTKYRNLVAHWVQIHRPYIRKYPCCVGTCAKMVINKKQLRRHMTRSHHLPVDVARTNVGRCQGSMKSNYRYISPGEAQLPVAEVSPP
ncbi:uncharacterized protein LOC117318580 [Pecten maximus]|uniref:uncharacterized protein LOC117318580 n=1 Tax=Pecten maximus TaxID=6579 RepID=UPI001458836B|nr:uncharacterized protein LOC117318580 [Pecten maximus]